MAEDRQNVEERANELTMRALAYAETAVEGIRLASWDAVEALDSFAKAHAELVARRGELTADELLVHVAKLVAELAGALAPALDAEVSDQEIVAHAVSRAFMVGYGAKLEEPSRRGRALGGVADDLRRRKARRHATAPTKPRRRDTGED